MEKFTDRVRQKATPVAFALALAPGGGIAQSQPLAKLPAEVVWELKDATEGMSICAAAYPALTQTPSGKVKPYMSNVVCGGEKIDFFDLVKTIAMSSADHRAQMPKLLELEFKSGENEVTQFQLEPQRVLNLHKALAMKGFKGNCSLNIVYDKEPGIETRVTDHSITFNVSHATLNSTPADVLADKLKYELFKAQTYQRGQKKETAGLSI